MEAGLRQRAAAINGGKGSAGQWGRMITRIGMATAGKTFFLGGGYNFVLFVAFERRMNIFFGEKMMTHIWMATTGRGAAAEVS